MVVASAAGMDVLRMTRPVGNICSLLVLLLLTMLMLMIAIGRWIETCDMAIVASCQKTTDRQQRRCERSNAPSTRPKGVNNIDGGNNSDKG